MAIKNMPSPDQYVRSLEPRRAPQKPRRGWNWPQRLVAILLMLILAVIAYGGYLAFSLSANPLDVGALAGTGGRTNILILGQGDPGHAGEKLTDTVMVMSIKPQTKEIAMISLPRDLRVYIQGYGYAKINQASAQGGPQLAAQTVSDTLGIPIHYYMLTNFSGLKQAVDAVGGVDITATEELRDTEYPCDPPNEGKACGLDIKPGQYHMNGEVALEYARCRKGTCGNDFGRAQRQQQVLQQIEQKAANPWLILHPIRLKNLTVALTSNLRTNMSVTDLIQVAYAWKHASRNISAVYSTSPGGLLRNAPGSSDLIPIGGSYGKMQDYAQNVFEVPPLGSPNP